MITSSFTPTSFGPGGCNSGLVHGTLIRDRNGHTHYDMIQKKIKSLLVFPFFDRSNTNPTNDFDGRQSVNKELEVMREVLKHPNVLLITKIGYLQGDTRVYTYSPRCNAGDLGQVFNTVKKPDWFGDESSRRRMMLGASRGLRFLHDIKDLHYDLKPHNIFLHSQGHGKPPHVIIGDVDTILQRKTCVHQLQKITYPIGRPFWGTPFIKCDPRIDIVPLAICTFLCVWNASANPNVFTEIAQQAIIDAVTSQIAYNRSTLQHIAKYWGWIPMPDHYNTRAEGTLLTDTNDTAVYTEFSNVLAHIDEKTGGYKPWELIMALTNKESLTSVWPKLCDPFISWLHVSLTTGDTTMTTTSADTTRMGGDQDMYFPQS